MPSTRRRWQYRLASVLVLPLITLVLLGAGAAAAEGVTRTATATTLNSSSRSLQSYASSTSIFGTVTRPDKRALSAARIGITQRDARTGEVLFSSLTFTDSAGRYQLDVTPTTSVNVTATFLGSSSYLPSASEAIQINVRTASPPMILSNQSDANEILTRMQSIYCDGYKNTIGNMTVAGSPTSELILGAAGDQTAANCKGDRKNVFSSIVSTLKEFTAGLALKKTLSTQQNEELVGNLVNLISAINPRFKDSPESVLRTYRAFLRATYNAVSPIINNCLKLPRIADAAACVKTEKAYLDKLYAITFGF